MARKAEPRQAAQDPGRRGKNLRLHHRPCRPANPVRTGGVLDRRRHRGDFSRRSATTATYFAFSDDVLKGLIARQAEQQYAYEDRIAELRAQIDRTTSRQLLDQEQFEQKLNDLLRRQTALESRATALSGISDPTTTGSLRSSTGGNEPKPSPTGHIADAASARPRHRARARRAPANRKSGKEADIGTELGRIEASLDRVDVAKPRCWASCRRATRAKPAKCNPSSPSLA